MLDDLLQEVERVSSEDEAETIVRSCELTDDGLRVDIEIRSDHYSASACSAWTLVTRGMRNFEFSPGWVGDLPQLLTAHPVLLPYTEPQSVLHILGSTPDPLSILGSLYLRHSACFGNWLKFSECVSSVMFTSGPWLREHGIVASGPVTLLQSYQIVLESYGLRCSIPPGHGPFHRRDGKWHHDDSSLCCVLLGSNWVVAESFVASRR